MLLQNFTWLQDGGLLILLCIGYTSIQNKVTTVGAGSPGGVLSLPLGLCRATWLFGDS